LVLLPLEREPVSSSLPWLPRWSPALSAMTACPPAASEIDFPVSGFWMPAYTRQLTEANQVLRTCRPLAR